MITRTSYKGKKYTLHIKDGSTCELNPGISIQVSKNEITEHWGCAMLLANDVSVDELAELILNHTTPK